MKKFQISSHQRGLLFKNEQLVQVLGTGVHRYWDLLNTLKLERVDLNQWVIKDPNLIRLYQQHNMLHAEIGVLEAGINQVGLLLVNQVLEGIVAPGERLYVWRAAGQIELELVDLTTGPLEPALLQRINQAGCNQVDRLFCHEHRARLAPVADVLVGKEHKAMLYVDGVLQQVLPAGQYGFWQLQHKVDIRQVDMRQLTMEINGQEILSKDRVSLRLNLTLLWRIVEPELAFQQVDKPEEYCYKLTQLALREAIGCKTLDDLLIDKHYVVTTVRQLVGPALEAVGIQLKQVGVKDLILPGEMRQILNQVVEAQKAAEANVIRRREETNATRSLLNTAKVMENNPVLLRLKELEALEKVAEKIQNLNLYGGLEQLMQGVVKLT